MDASSDLQCDASDPVHPKEGPLTLLSRVLADSVESPEDAGEPVKAHKRLGIPYL